MCWLIPLSLPGYSILGIRRPTPWNAVCLDRISALRKYLMNIHSPKGTTTSHLCSRYKYASQYAHVMRLKVVVRTNRSASVQIALIYGSRILSSKEGNVSFPKTRSSSSWARACTSGLESIPSIALIIVVETCKMTQSFHSVFWLGGRNTVSWPPAHC